LAGGLYGIDLGHVFCGESMFSLTSNASKFAFIKLAQELQEKEYKIIDCQLHTDHLESLGAKEISRIEFLKFLK
jgi:leucyl/phenylalanyl-tRNA--protein transferase